ncbi:hypothetical protein Pst134EA_028162 [Puccinia striiformis f. sp. tritici]|uniref:hypothetical protein n=1 Tax=Puccinia striiformis f. sp. tritici TaxID=168172 RepID=UPI002008E900|nr:hypothetical protein Pst134EA_028162 [Puccinia striiformis f. sp. tritici]KAH9448870.1 hypothetical protein Pst134EA_028162 [Puccinia striiformis f. sp. tritici]
MLLAVLTLPSAFILWASIRIALDVKAIEMASEKIMAGLLEAAPTYRPETYNLMQILEILKPGQGFAIRTNHLAHDAKLILLLYLVLQLTGAALYVPTSMLAFRGLRKQTASGSAQKKKKEAREAPMSQHQTPMTKLMNDGPGQEKAALESVRRRLVKHAWLLYLDTILYCPILVYMLSYNKTSFFRDPTWMVLEQVATHAHTAIIGNVILCLLIQNALYTTRKSSKTCIVVVQSLTHVTFDRQTTEDTKTDLSVRSLI